VPLIPRQSFGTLGFVFTGGEGGTTSPNITARADLKVARDGKPTLASELSRLLAR
jgi:hypothetical protein